MAAGGTSRAGYRLLSREGVEAALREGVVRFDTELEGETTFTQGGLCVFSGRPSDNGGTVGWMGYGGSCFQWHPTVEISFGFAMNAMATDINNGSQASAYRDRVS